MIKRTYILLLFMLVTFAWAGSQDIPNRPDPPRLVNDFAGMLNQGQVSSLEGKLVAFNDSTSTQIAIVTVPSLEGYDKADYAQRLAEKWGIGQKGKDNGVLILVKPKTGNSQGQVQIAQGYGLEGILPDITAAEIIDQEILPAFREGDYYGGLDRATSTIMAITRGEYTAEQYGMRSKSVDTGSPGAFFVILMIVLFIIFSGRGRRGGRNRRITTKSDLPIWLLMSMLGSGNKHGGSWGGFSGGGGFGRGGGGFGGFGGGSFGGGGAGGSW